MTPKKCGQVFCSGNHRASLALHRSIIQSQRLRAVKTVVIRLSLTVFRIGFTVVPCIYHTDDPLHETVDRLAVGIIQSALSGNTDFAVPFIQKTLLPQNIQRRKIQNADPKGAPFRLFLYDFFCYNRCRSCRNLRLTFCSKSRPRHDSGA